MELPSLFSLLSNLSATGSTKSLGSQITASSNPSLKQNDVNLTPPGNFDDLLLGSIVDPGQAAFDFLDTTVVAGDNPQVDTKKVPTDGLLESTNYVDEIAIRAAIISPQGGDLLPPGLSIELEQLVDAEVQVDSMEPKSRDIDTIPLVAETSSSSETIHLDNDIRVEVATSNANMYAPDDVKLATLLIDATGVEKSIEIQPSKMASPRQMTSSPQKTGNPQSTVLVAEPLRTRLGEAESDNKSERPVTPTIVTSQKPVSLANQSAPQDVADTSDIIVRKPKVQSSAVYLSKSEGSFVPHENKLRQEPALKPTATLTSEIERPNASLNLSISKPPTTTLATHSNAASEIPKTNVMPTAKRVLKGTELKIEHLSPGNTTTGQLSLDHLEATAALRKNPGWNLVTPQTETEKSISTPAQQPNIPTIHIPVAEGKTEFSSDVKLVPAVAATATIATGPASASALDQMVQDQFLRTMAARGLNQQSITLQLNPTHLGILDITLSQEHGDVSISVVAREPQTKDMFDALIPRLRQSLQEMGVQVGELDIRQGGGESKSQDQHNSEDTRKTTTTTVDEALPVTAKVQYQSDSSVSTFV